MFRCAICHFDIELDDVVLAGKSHLCVCLRCYLREAGIVDPMPKLLKRDILDALNPTP